MSSLSSLQSQQQQQQQSLQQRSTWDPCQSNSLANVSESDLARVRALLDNGVMDMNMEMDMDAALDLMST
ncbi:hypothetical protein FBU30_008481, partial [Linnemannia zychae]